MERERKRWREMGGEVGRGEREKMGRWGDRKK